MSRKIGTSEIDPSDEGVRAWTSALVLTTEEIGREKHFETVVDHAQRLRLAIAKTYAVLEQFLKRTLDPAVVPVLKATNAAFPITAPLLADSYERLLDYRPRPEKGNFALERTEGQRKESGSYFTPPELVRILLEHSVLPVLQRRLVAGAFGAALLDPMKVRPLAEWTPAERIRAEEALLTTTVCDPACGPGNFLLAASELLTNRLLALRYPVNDIPEGERTRAQHDVAKSCLYGVDRDPQTVAVARLALWLAAGKPEGEPVNFAIHLHTGDSLCIGVDDRYFPVTAVEWQDDFPEVFARGGFDVVVGNPPFANAIESGVAVEIKERLGQLYPNLRGTADLSYYFLELAHRITHPEGAVGLVLPRGVLTGRSTYELRKELLRDRPPCLIYAPQNQYLFPGANVFVVLLSLARSGVCLASRDAMNPRFFSVTVSDENWWAPLLEEMKPSLSADFDNREGLGAAAVDTHSRFRTVRRISDEFEVFASMTTGMAYDVLAFVSDEPQKNALKLVTTGLIDPGICHWGTRTCRYLKRRFASPFVHENPRLHASLVTRLEKVRRPKILVAGLSTRVEAFLDEKGEYCGAVSTFTIIDARDDVATLRQLLDQLNGPLATAALHRELGAHAMGGGRITLSKQFLSQLALP